MRVIFWTKNGREVDFEARDRSDRRAQQREREAARQRAMVAAWTHPVGTSVLVRRDDGSEQHTITRSSAWMLGDDGRGGGGHTAVILLDGIRGAYSLERVRLAQKGAA